MSAAKISAARRLERAALALLVVVGRVHMRLSLWRRRLEHERLEQTVGYRIIQVPLISDDEAA